jgi:hypothetical protein
LINAKSIPTLQQLAKIEMKDLSQGVVVSLFDQQPPKILSDVTGYIVVQKDESHFNQLKTYKEWAEPQTGFRDRLKIALETFELAHNNLVTDKHSSIIRGTSCCSLISDLCFGLDWGVHQFYR